MIPLRGGWARAGAWPWITVAWVAAASLIFLLPGTARVLEYDRAAVEAGEVWRLLTGQLVHWTPRMAVADLSVLLVVGVWLEIRSRRLALAALVTGAILVGPGLIALAPDLSQYRGSSGLASALFVAAALDMVAHPSRRWARHLALAAVVLFAAKLLWEIKTGQALAAGPLLPGVVVTPAAHLLGGLAGLLAYGLLHRPRTLIESGCLVDTR